MIFSVFSLAACSTILWLRTLSLARAEANSLVVRACRARSCHAMARSVRHWSASPSGSLTGSFCKDTSSDRMVSSRGLRDRRHRGQRNFRSLAACTAEAWELLFFMFADFGRGTHVPKTETNFITYCWQNEYAYSWKLYQWAGTTRVVREDNIARRRQPCVNSNNK